MLQWSANTPTEAITRLEPKDGIEVVGVTQALDGSTALAIEALNKKIQVWQNKALSSSYGISLEGYYGWLSDALFGPLHYTVYVGVVLLPVDERRDVGQMLGQRTDGQWTGNDVISDDVTCERISHD
jgi:hypothetical protein